MQTKYTPFNIIRALRLPFLTASCLPFAFGSLIERKNFNLAGFILGLLAVTTTHLSANLINDYFDSKAGADWRDRKFYGFFGGSKLIQEGVLPEEFYLKGAVIMAFIAFTGVILLSLNLKSLIPVIIYLFIIFLSWQYTAKPLSFSYHGLGEIFIFLLFGPAAVMGGYFIQTGIFPNVKSFILSFPFGFFTLAILLANEIADYPDDKAVGKNNWIVLAGLRMACLIYYVSIFAGFTAILSGFYLQYLSMYSLVSLFWLPQAVRTGKILKNSCNSKKALVISSRQAVNMQALISIILIISLIVKD